jgi:CBS domain-containing protein
LALGRVATRRPVCIDRDATIVAASRLMRAQDVAELVVIEPREQRRVPAGIISARDIITRIVAFNLDAAALTVGDILWARTAAGHVSDGIHETLERLIATGSDALPIVDSDGNLAGVVLVDDLLRALAET